MTNLEVTAFLAIGVLGPPLPLGVPTPLVLRETVGGGVTSSSTFLLSLKVIRPDAEVVMCWGVLLADGGNATFSGDIPIVSK